MQCCKEKPYDVHNFVALALQACYSCVIMAGIILCETMLCGFKTSYSPFKIFLFQLFSFVQISFNSQLAV